MRIIISPAKKMREDTDTLAPWDLPAFLADTERLKAALQGMTPQELQDKLALLRQRKGGDLPEEDSP